MPAHPRDDGRLLDELRPVALSIAYRMLGSVSEAEDVVQEALMRVHQVRQSGEQITSPRALVATVTTRLAINELQSARARRERYVGEWLPEPIITDDDPARRAELADSLSLALLVLLESLSRARRHVQQRRPRFQTTREQRDELVARFFGKVPALAQPLRSRTRIARLLIDSVLARLPRLRIVEVNGGPGALLFDAQDQLIGVMALDVAGDQIRSIYSIVNPDKLVHIRREVREPS